MGFWHDLTAKSSGLFGGPAKQAAAARQAELEQQNIKIALMRKWINNASAYHRCRIGRITIKALK